MKKLALILSLILIASLCMSAVAEENILVT